MLQALPQYKQVVIIGAGPAGLSLGYELKRRNIDFVVLEKGAGPGESFRRYPKNIWFGPWLNNTLPGSRVAWHWNLRRATQPAYTWYLGEYARRNELPICCGVNVMDVRHEGPGFVVETDAGTVQCKVLVNATGYFSKPFVPAFPGRGETDIPLLHSSQYREPADADQALGNRPRTALIVGQGLSAGETMCELHRAGYDVALSHRGPLVFGPSPTMEAVLSPFHWVVEQLAVALDIRLPSNPPMAGGESKRLVESGWVETYGEIERFEHEQVVFRDGRRRCFGLVIFCTGYCYAVDHLVRLLRGGAVELTADMESAAVPDLFFLGLDQQRTYRSRFLRGIRSDAVALAKILDRRLLRQAPPQSVEEFTVDPGLSEATVPEPAFVGSNAG